MAERELTYEDLVRLVELIKTTSHFSQFRLKVGEIEVEMRRVDGAAPRPQPAVLREETSSPAAHPPGQIREFPENLHLVRSPMVGTFYAAPAPDKPPFVQVGQRVSSDTQVCIIEVMKLMNSIEAGRRGVVSEILVENGAAVEHGQVLMVIEPAG